MSVTLKIEMKIEMKITAGEPIWLIVPAFFDGPKSISLAWRNQAENVPLGGTRETQGWGRNFASINCSITVSSNHWLDDDVV